MTPLDRIPHGAAAHFRLWFFVAVLHLRERLPGVEEELPFLRGYGQELDAAGLDRARFVAALEAWERAAGVRLPLAELREAAGLDAAAMTLLFTIGMVEEDGRFAAALASGHGRPHPSPGVLAAWFPRPALTQLLRAGLVEPVDAAAPRLDWALQPSPPLWEALRGDRPGADWLAYTPPDDLPTPDELVIDAAAAHALARAPAALAATTTVVRGPAASGRRTLLAALARRLGRGMIELRGFQPAGESRWSAVGALATTLHAMPVVAFDPAPGDRAELPALPAYSGPLGVALGRHGGLGGPRAEQLVTLELGMPGAADRARHWAAALDDPSPAPALAVRHRMTGGNIRRAATLAAAEAALAGHAAVTAADVRRGTRALHGRLLDALAERVETSDPQDLVVAADVKEELRLVEARCRHRERLDELAAGARPGPGVRALFTGPSGTGKTLAARVLAGALDRDLYRLDLASVVDKYIGETEKNLARVFARAEEADIALLLDEGDALLTQRTAVQNANDRYANLETNYLLQRLESYEGILIVTTNAGDRIDAAFRRRMDVVVGFRAPGPLERLAIWERHLPPGHDVEPAVLDEVSARCELTGGQIRNAALHAALLALAAGARVDADRIERAIRREYRKSGQICPLRPRVHG